MGNRIETKAEFLRKSSLGLLGNHPHYWASPSEAREDGHEGEVAIRYRERDSPFCKFNVPLDGAEDEIERMRSRGADPAKIYLNEMEFGAERILQGEVWRSPGGLYLNYTTTRGGLRTALERDGHHAERSAAMAILGAYLDANSLDDLDSLFELYPDAVIEFTAFDRPIGAIPMRNTIFWETRDY